MTALTFVAVRVPPAARDELPQDERRDRLRGVLLPADLQRELGAHSPLDQLDAVVRVDCAGLHASSPTTTDPSGSK